MSVNCTYWTDCGVKGGGCCTHPKRPYGDFPSKGTCGKKCAYRVPAWREGLLPPASDVEADPKNDKGCGCSPEPEMFE